MIDTIEIKLITKELGKLEEYSYNIINNKEGKEYHNCNIRNLRVTYTKHDSEYQIKIYGSLHKFLHGYNLTRFTRLDAKKAIDLLSESLGIDVNKGLVKRVDIGANIFVNYPASIYNSFLFSWKRSEKDTHGNNATIDFRGNGISLSFYDKNKEVKNNREAKVQYSSFLKDFYLIRYELRLTKKLQKHLKLPQRDLYVSDLYTFSIYKQLVNLWYQQYKTVKKNYFYRPAEVYSNFNDYLKNEGIERLGGILNTFQILDNWCKVKGLGRQAKYTIKNKIRKEYKELTPANNLIKELNRKIKFEKEFYI